VFERYTEKARRTIFFGKYEASHLGSRYIDPEHLLLGLLREHKALTKRFRSSHASVESIRKQIEAHNTTHEKVPTSVDIPLSKDCKRVHAYAAEEADRLSHKHIGTEHLVLGLLREESCFAAQLLREHGLALLSVRDEMARNIAKGHLRVARHGGQAEPPRPSIRIRLMGILKKLAKLFYIRPNS
jgi:ATP-dependent Clp protease ATP-binding subunit ClpC